MLAGRIYRLNNAKARFLRLKNGMAEWRDVTIYKVIPRSRQVGALRRTPAWYFQKYAIKEIEMRDEWI